MPYSSPTPAVQPVRVKALLALWPARSVKVLRSRAKAAPPIESRTDAAGNGRGPLRLGADGITEEIAAVPLYSSPIEIALDAEDEHVPLIVGADLAAAEKACTARESVASAGERIAPGGTAGTPANLSADIEAGPGIDRRRRGGDGCHRYPGKRQIGGGRGS